MTPTSPLRLMLWLKWTLLWRGYRQSRMRVLGAVLFGVAFLPVSVGAAWLVWFFSTLRPDIAPVVARDVLAVIYALWALTPLLGFQLNEAFDLTRLFVYPLTYRQIFFGSVLGGLLDLPVLLTLPLFGVLLALHSASAGGWIVNSLILALFLLHTLALGQAVTLTLIGFLRSRRFRDLTIVLFPLIGMGYYVGQRVFFSQLHNASPERLLDAPAWRAVGVLPPGWAALGLSASAQGDWNTALLMLGGMALVTLATLAAAARVLQALYLGDAGPRRPHAAPSPAFGHPLPFGMREGLVTGGGLAPHGGAKPQSVLPLAPPSLRGGGVAEGRGEGLRSHIPPIARAVAGKEWLYLKREPQYKAMAVNVLYTLAAIGLPILLPLTGRGEGEGRWAAWGEWLLYGLTGTLLLSGLPLLFNIFGAEGAAITVLFSFPARRRDVLLGKNLAHGALLLGLCAVGLTVMAVLLHQWHALPSALALAALAVPVLLATGNLVSIRLPHRMLVRGQRWSKGGLASAGSGGAGEGCAYAFLYLLAYAAAFVATLPAVAAALLPGRFGISVGWYALSLPLAAVYAGGLYVLLLGQAEGWLARREPEIAGRIVPEL